MTSFSRLHFKTLVNKLEKVLCIDGEFEKKEMKRTMGGEREVKRGNKWGNFGEESNSPESRSRSLGSRREPIIGV